MLSASDPLSDAVGEGTLVGLSERQATVVLEPGAAGGEVAAARWLEHQGWRLDKGANRTSFKRQLEAVIALVSAPPSRAAPRIFTLISSGEIAPPTLRAERRRAQGQLARSREQLARSR